MIRFAIIGSGWRSLFYARTAQALPEEFELCAMLCRTQEKADKMRREYGIPTTTDEREILRLKPDFVVSAVSKAGMYDTSTRWLDMGCAVLAETPISLDLDRLYDIWRRHKAGQKIQVAEQYFLRPDYASILSLVRDGVIGQPVSMTISAMHDYHAASMIRCALQMDIEDVAITGKKFVFPVANTKTRYETLTDGKLCPKEQTHLILEYASGKTAFYDFTAEQYRSTIRSRYLNIRGTRGETVGHTVYYLDENNLGHSAAIKSLDPLMEYGLGEDEAAIAQLLRGMKGYIDTSCGEIYPMRYALEDAYIAALMTKAGDEPYHTCRSAPRPWAE